MEIHLHQILYSVEYGRIWRVLKLELGGLFVPLIDQALLEGPLSPAERLVLTVVTTKFGYIWSDSLDDLCEIARWTTRPDLKNCPELCPASLQHNQSIVQAGEIVLTINCSVTCYAGYSHDSPQEDTYTLRTISNALNRLARTKRIWAFELHGRRHYGAKSARDMVRSKYDELPDEQKEEANFIEEITFLDKDAKGLSE